MTHFVYGPHVVVFVADRINRKGQWKDSTGIGVERDGKLIGGVVIDDYIPGVRCGMHCAGDDKRWLSKTFLQFLFDYVFRQLGCKVILTTAKSNNPQGRTLLRKVGFTEECTVPDGFADADMVIYTLPKAKCRWLSPKARSV